MREADDFLQKKLCLFPGGKIRPIFWRVWQRFYHVCSLVAGQCDITVGKIRFDFSFEGVGHDDLFRIHVAESVSVRVLKNDADDFGKASRFMLEQEGDLAASNGNGFCGSIWNTAQFPMYDEAADKRKEKISEAAEKENNKKKNEWVRVIKRAPFALHEEKSREDKAIDKTDHCSDAVVEHSGMDRLLLGSQRSTCCVALRAACAIAGFNGQGIHLLIHFDIKRGAGCTFSF